MKTRTCALLLAAILLPSLALAHPSPIDFGLFHRHDIGMFFALVALLVSVLFYTITGLKRSNRAITVQDYFFYNKEASLGQYFDTTVGYSFQVVVTVYFVYLGFNYGIWIVSYVITWVLGFYFFQLFSPKLLEFMALNETLHGFLSQRLDLKLIKKITAVLTILGLLGGLIIEVNYTTDILKYLALDKIDLSTWIVIFLSILFITWYYVQYGGFKATVNIATYQLPIIYVTLSIVLAYIIWLTFLNGDCRHGLYIGIFLMAAWIIVYFARLRTLQRVAKKDLATIASLISFSITAITTIFLSIKFGVNSKSLDTIKDLPNSFSPIDGFKFQDTVVFVGFAILNMAWQFFDMSAWQRLTSINVDGLSFDEKKNRVRKAIGETKFESPVTWLFGILFGIGLHHSGLFNSSTQAFDAFNIFIKTLSDNDFSPALGMIGSYVVLPCLIIAFFGIALSTTDSFLNSITYSWISDLSRHSLTNTELQKSMQESKIIKRANKAALIIMLVGAVLFIIINKIIKLDILVILNLVYSAQFLICFFTFSALLLRHPRFIKKTVTAAVFIACFSIICTAVFCYDRMNHTKDAYWSDWIYILPTIVCFSIGFIIIVPSVFYNWKKLK